MKINRIELIGRVREMIAERERECAEARATAERNAEEAAETYAVRHADDWSRFADRIRLRLRQGKPITADDVPEGLHTGSGYSATGVKLFRPEKMHDSNFVPRVATLNRLLAVLESCPDDEISTAQLDRLGAPLRELMRL